MEAGDVKAFRENLEKATFTMYSRKDGSAKKFIPDINIICDNSLNLVDDHQGAIIWDDANSRLYAFRYNTPNMIYKNPTQAMGLGNLPKTTAAVICVDYGEIQNLRAAFNREAFENFLTALGSLITEDQKVYLRKKLFVDVDQDIVIQRKQKTSYVTGVSKDHNISSKHYTEMDEYNKTVHTN